MTSEARKLPKDIVDQLSSLESRGDAGLHDLGVLHGIREGIRKLLDDGDEKTVRSLLRDRLDRGDLRRETYELVVSMLERFVREDLPTSSAAGGDVEDDMFASTTVIEPDSIAGQAPDQRLQVGSVLRDRFLLQERVAGGSMGVVYKALDRRRAEAGENNCHVAIKVLAPALADNARALRALQQEAAKGRCLVHPHIVRFIDLDRDDDLYFIVMEWLDGENLAMILDRAETITADRALDITQQVGRALDYAHRCGIVHADVKPANVMIMADGSAKLFDFGVARVRQAQEKSDFNPGELGAMTPAYSSMQVLTGEEPVPEDDVFSLACLYYRLIAGYRVFGPRNAAEAAESGMTPQPLQGVSDRQWKAVRKALSYSRVARYPSVREFLDELAPPAESFALSPDDLSQRSSATEEPRRSKLPWIAAVLVVLAAAAWFSGLLDGFNPAGERSADRLAAGAPQSGDAANLQPAAAADAPGAGSRAAAATASAAEPRAAATAASLPAFPPGNTSLRVDDSDVAQLEVTLGENEPAFRIDLLRAATDSNQELTIAVDGFSGNRSPLATGDLKIEPADRIRFARGQARSQLVLAMRDDPLREADASVMLQLRDANGVERAAIDVRLVDDDQRRFELGLPVNTVAFAAGQISVAESDNVAQIEILRYRPDERSMRIAFTVSDVTATAGDDYFAPTENIVEFAPGQRSARILIPLVQDTEIESNEAFVVELASTNVVANAEIYERVAVMIRDDD